MKPSLFSSFSRSSRSGFSFIEILFVMLIIAVIAVLAIPEVQNQMRSSRAQAETENLRTIQGAKLAWMKDNPGLELPGDIEAAKAAISVYLPYGWPQSPWGVEYEGINDINVAVSSPVNGDPRFEPRGGGDLHNNGFNDLGLSRNVYLVAPDVEGTLATWTGGGSYTTIPPPPNEDTWVLNLRVEPPGSGTTTGAGTYNAGQAASFDAFPADATWRFSAWEEDLAGKNKNDTIMGPPNRSGVARMERINHTLTVVASPAEGGTVTPAGVESHVYGSVAQAGASANSGWRLTGFSGDTDGGTSTVSDASGTVTGLVMNQNRTVTANFERITAELQISKVVSATGPVPDTTFTLRLEGPVQDALPSGFRNYSFTNAGGSIPLTGLIAGTYTLSEPTVPDEFSSSGTDSVVLDWGDSESLSITNTYSPEQLIVGKTADAPSVQVFSSSIFTLTVTNPSVYTAQGVSLSDTLPVGTTPSAPQLVSGPGSVSLVGRTVIWNGNLAPGASLVIRVPYTMDTVGQKTNVVDVNGITAQATVTGVWPDNDLSVGVSPMGAAVPQGAGRFPRMTEVPHSFINKGVSYSFIGWSGDSSSTSVSDTLVLDGDKSVVANFTSVTKTGPASLEVGQEGVFTITVSNPSGIASGVRSAVDVFPAGLLPLSASVASGPGSVVLSGQTVTWTGALNPGQSAVVSVPFRMETEGSWLNRVDFGDGHATHQVTGTPIPNVNLNVSVSPAGAATPAGSGTYPRGSTQAYSFSGKGASYDFIGWSGDASGTANPGSILMDANKNVVANFIQVGKTGPASVMVGQPGTFTITVSNPSAISSGAKTVVDTLPAGMTATGASITSGPGSVSRSGNTVTWNGTLGAGQSTVISIPFTMDTEGAKVNTVTVGGGSASHTVTGTPIPNVVLGVSVLPVGAATPAGSGTYPLGSTQAYSFSGKGASYDFIGWSGNATGTANPGSILMDGNKSVVANFVQISKTGPASVMVGETGTFVITVSNPSAIASGAKTVVDTLPAGMTAIGATITSGPGSISRSGNTVTWNGTLAAGQSTVISIPFTMDTEGSMVNTVTVGGGSASHTVVGTAVPLYSLDVEVSPEGAATPVGSGAYPLNSTQSYSFSGKGANYDFIGWSGDATGTANSGSILMDSDKTVVANFIQVGKTGPASVMVGQTGTFTITVSNPSWISSGAKTVVDTLPTGMTATGASITSGPGSVSRSGNTVTWDGILNSHQSVTISIPFTMDTEGSKLNTVTVGGGSASHTVVGTPIPNVNLNVSVSPVGAATPAGSGVYPLGSTQSYSFSGKGASYDFIGWSGDASGTANPGSILMDANKNVVANFVQIAKTGPASVVVGQSGTFTITVSNPSAISSGVKTVVDTLPAGMTATGASITSGPGSVSRSGNTVTWNGTLGAGQSTVISIPFTMDTEGAKVNTVTVGGGSASHTVLGTPPPLGSVSVVKAVTNSYPFPTPSATFTLLLEGPAGFSETVVFDESGGSSTFIDLPVGVYTLSEPSVPAGWTSSGTVFGTVLDGENLVLTITNEYTPELGSLVLRKLLDGDPYPYPAEFILRVTGPHGFLEDVPINQAGGYATLSNLFPGTYTVTELDPMPGVTVTGEGPVQVLAGVTTDHDVVNTYTVSSYELTVLVSPSGAARPLGSGTFMAGTDATYSFDSREEDYTFVGWSGDVSNTQPSGSITMDSSKTVVANFVRVTKTGDLAVNVGDVGLFTITISNLSSISSGPRQMVDNLPLGVTPISATLISGPGSVVLSGMTVTWNGTLASGQSSQVVVSYTMATEGQKVNRATVDDAFSDHVVRGDIPPPVSYTLTVYAQLYDWDWNYLGTELISQTVHSANSWGSFLFPDKSPAWFDGWYSSAYNPNDGEWVSDYDYNLAGAVHMFSDRVVYGTYYGVTPEEVTLNVVVSPIGAGTAFIEDPDGNNVGTSVTLPYNSGNVMMYTAASHPGYVFDGWTSHSWYVWDSSDAGESSSSVSVTTLRSDTIVANYAPLPWPGDVRLRKEVINNTSFPTPSTPEFTLRLHGPGGAMGNYVSTVAGNTWDFPDLGPGEYQVYETPPADWTIDASSVMTGTLHPGDALELVVVNRYNPVLGNLRVVKEVTNTVGFPIPSGTEFVIRVTGPHGYSQELTFGATGGEQLLSGLFPGIYEVTEPVVPPGFTRTGGGTIEVLRYQTSVSTIVNSYDVPPGDGEITVSKIVTNNTGRPTPAASFGLTLTGPYGVVRTATFGSSGGSQTFSNLPAGEYTLTETSVPSGWIPSAPVSTVLESDESASLSITNEWVGTSLAVSKVVVNNTGQPTPPANFTLVVSGPGGFSESIPFDETGGTVYFSGVQPGLYTVQEPTRPGGWDGGEGSSVEVVADETGYLSVTNEWVGGTLIVTKSIANPNNRVLLPGTFTIRVSGSGGELASWNVSQVGGIREIRGLVAGFYTVSEDTPTANHWYGPAPQSVSVNYSTPTDVTVLNTFWEPLIRVQKQIEPILTLQYAFLPQPGTGVWGWYEPEGGEPQYVEGAYGYAMLPASPPSGTFVVEVTGPGLTEHYAVLGSHGGVQTLVVSGPGTYTATEVYVTPGWLIVQGTDSGTLSYLGTLTLTVVNEPQHASGAAWWNSQISGFQGERRNVSGNSPSHSEFAEVFPSRNVDVSWYELSTRSTEDVYSLGVTQSVTYENPPPPDPPEPDPVCNYNINQPTLSGGYGGEWEFRQNSTLNTVNRVIPRDPPSSMDIAWMSDPDNIFNSVQDGFLDTESGTAHGLENRTAGGSESCNDSGSGWACGANRSWTWNYTSDWSSSSSATSNYSYTNDVPSYGASRVFDATEDTYWSQSNSASNYNESGTGWDCYNMRSYSYSWGEDWSGGHNQTDGVGTGWNSYDGDSDTYNIPDECWTCPGIWTTRGSLPGWPVYGRGVLVWSMPNYDPDATTVTKTTRTEHILISAPLLWRENYSGSGNDSFVVYQNLSEEWTGKRLNTELRSLITAEDYYNGWSYANSSSYYESISQSGSTGSIDEDKSTWDVNLPSANNRYQWYRIDSIDYTAEYVKSEDKNWGRGNYSVRVREVYSQPITGDRAFSDEAPVVRGHPSIQLGNWVGDDYIVNSRATRKITYKPIHDLASPPSWASSGSFPTDPASQASVWTNFVDAIYADVLSNLNLSQDELEAMRDQLTSLPIPSSSISSELSRINSALSALTTSKNGLDALSAELQELPGLGSAYSSASSAYEAHLSATRALQEQRNDLEKNRTAMQNKRSWNNSAAWSVGSEHPSYSGFISARDQFDSQISSLNTQITALTTQINGRTSQQNTLWSTLSNARSAYDNKVSSIATRVEGVLQSNWVGM